MYRWASRAQLWQMFADPISVQTGRNRLKLAANLGRCLFFQVKGILVWRTSKQRKKDDRLGCWAHDEPLPPGQYWHPTAHSRESSRATRSLRQPAPEQPHVGSNGDLDSGSSNGPLNNLKETRIAVMRHTFKYADESITIPRDHQTIQRIQTRGPSRGGFHRT